MSSCARVVDHRRQVGRGTGVVAQPGERARAVVGQRGGKSLPAWVRLRRGRLIGVVVTELRLVGRQAVGHIPACGQAELQLLAAAAPARVVLVRLGDAGRAAREVGGRDALGEPAYRVVGGAADGEFARVVGVLHIGVIVATVGTGAARAGGAELRRLILHAAQPVQQVIGVANGARAGAILDEIPVGVIGVRVRAPVGVNQLCNAPQVVVLHGGLHAGHGLPALGRLVGDGEGGGFVQGVVDAGCLLHERERPAVGAALLLRVDRAAQHVGVGDGHVLIRVHRGHREIGVAVALRRAQAVVGASRVGAGQRRRTADAIAARVDLRVLRGDGPV